MPDARWSSHPHVVADCPVCDRPLPRILVDVDAWTGRQTPGVGPRKVLQLHVRAQHLDAAWWAVARYAHPDCIPDDVGVRSTGPVPRHTAEQCVGQCPDHRAAAS